MRKLIYLSICLFLLNCNKTEIEPPYQSEAVISGFDLGMCACCGGLIINIENTGYRIVKMPSNFDDSSNKISFPLSVSLDWQLKSTCGSLKFIEVSRIKIK